MAIMSVSDREIIAFLGARATTRNWEIRAKLKQKKKKMVGVNVAPSPRAASIPTVDPPRFFALPNLSEKVIDEKG